MNRKLSFLFFFFCVLMLNAQRVDWRLSNLMSENARVEAKRRAAAKTKNDRMLVETLDTAEIKSRINVSFLPDGTLSTISVLATLGKGESLPMDKLRNAGVDVINQIGNIVILSVPAKSFDALVNMQEFKRFDADGINRLYNDKVRKTTSTEYVTGENVDYVNFFTTNSYKPHKGAGVVVGVVDGGIDFNHPAFRNPTTGETRIKKAIYYDNNTMVVKTSANEINDLTTGNTSDSHGTHTSSIAAGSYDGDIHKYGIAPEADLVLCDLKSLSDANILNCCKEIFNYANTVGKPAVINLSLGGNADFHDGSTTLSSGLASMAGAGKIIVVSAGNEGARKMSVVKTLDSSKSLKTIVETTATDGSYVNGILAVLYSYNKTNFTVELKAVDITNGNVYSLEEKPLYKKNDGSTVVTPKYTTGKDTNEQYYAVVQTSACKFNDENLRLGLFVSGTEGQKITIIENRATYGETALCGSETYPNLSEFTEGNADMSINTLACSDNIISVGAFVNRKYFKSYADDLYYYWPGYEVVGQIASFSSYGIDDNGKARPDVLAPGHLINSALNIYDNGKNGFFDSNYDVATVDVTDYFSDPLTIGDYTRSVPYGYGAMSGTSMACPVVTGIVALWLQEKPTLTPAEVRALLKSTSLHDKYTETAENVPSGNLVQAGMGKIDALRGMKALLGEQEVNDVKFAIGNGRTITTYSSTNKLDFRNPNGPKAYIASTIDDNTLIFQRVLDRVPANTGLLITADAGVEYDIPIATSASAVENNYLVGTAEEDVTISEAEKCYVLSSQNGQIGFYPNGAGLVIPQGKAYLELPDSEQSNAKAILFTYDESEKTAESIVDAIPLEGNHAIEGRLVIEHDATSVESLKSQQINISDIYDLSGRKVTSPKKGMYIMGGKKVLFE